MQALSGYYDGNTIRPIERIIAKRNQRVIITVLDEFLDDSALTKKKGSVRGALSAYANPALIEKEQHAWEIAAREQNEAT